MTGCSGCNEFLDDFLASCEENVTFPFVFVCPHCGNEALVTGGHLDPMQPDFLEKTKELLTQNLMFHKHTTTLTDEDKETIDTIATEMLDIAINSLCDGKSFQ